MDEFTTDEQRIILHAALMALGNIDDTLELSDYLGVPTEDLSTLTERIGRTVDA